MLLVMLPYSMGWRVVPARSHDHRSLVVCAVAPAPISRFIGLTRRPIMFKTKNDLPEDVRIKAAKLLNARLADSIDLQTQTKQAHWNVKGPNFIALHELFDQINAAVEDYVDDIAERAVQLGGVAEGTARMVALRSSLAEYPAAVDGRGHVEALSSALAAFGKLARKAIDDANEIGDLDTADLFTEVSRGIDKWLWFVEAHLQAER
jgi:starvation-inducible DNA-binding protein